MMMLVMVMMINPDPTPPRIAIVRSHFGSGVDAASAWANTDGQAEKEAKTQRMARQKA